MANADETFRAEVQANIAGLAKDEELRNLSRDWIKRIGRHKWAYNFTWLGRPAIQFPNDAWALQELIWRIKPDLIIETGIAHGGSLVFSASMMALLDVCDASAASRPLMPTGSARAVVGVDIDIRAHNRAAIEAHPLASRIKMIEGPSTDDAVVRQVRSIASQYNKILVCLDSNHTHEHVLAELKSYADLVSAGSYCIVYDTVIADLPDDAFPDRPWGPQNNPKTAVTEFLREHPEFEIDTAMDSKLMISVAPGGFLRRA